VTGGGESIEGGGTIVNAGSLGGIDEVVDGRLGSLTGDIVNGNGAMLCGTPSLGTEALCLNGVETDEAELDGLGLGRDGI
jgi:hypothetical protein